MAVDEGADGETGQVAYRPASVRKVTQQGRVPWTGSLVGQSKLLLAT